jgi:hypothetical protein
MNEWIRRQAGRVPAPVVERERPIGLIVRRDVPGPAVFPRRPMTNDVANARIRQGAAIVRSVQLRNGVNLNLDNPWL